MQAAQFNYKDARDTVVLAVGANYLLTIATESRVAAAQAELEDRAGALSTGIDQENAGLAPQHRHFAGACAVAGATADVDPGAERLEKQRIALARVIGLTGAQNSAW